MRQHRQPRPGSRWARPSAAVRSPTPARRVFGVCWPTTRSGLREAASSWSWSARPGRRPRSRRRSTSRTSTSRSARWPGTTRSWSCSRTSPRWSAGEPASGRSSNGQPAAFPRSISPAPIPRTGNGGDADMKKVVLAYSGGLDTSVAVAWLREQFGVDVVTLTVNVGGGSLRTGVEARAIAAGASRAYVVDARKTFVRDFCWPSLQANARYQGVYPLATALARPLIAQLLVEVAQKEGADAVAHGCTGKGNDQVRFDVAVHALDPALEVVAPMRVGMGLSHEQSIDYAAARGIELPITKASPYSIDVNMWGRSCETGVREDPRLAGTAPHVDVDGVGARLRDRELDAARGRVVDRLVA